MPLITADASPRTQRLYELLKQEAGRRVILGQQECPDQALVEEEMAYIRKVTGQLPGIRGLDFIHNDFDGVVGRALDWNDKGGIVSICWHTGLLGIGYPDSQQQNPDILRMTSPDTPEHGTLMRRWEACAMALEKLQQQDVPVLWRPFHEFDGGWFWWGKQGGEAFIRLWRMMVDTFTGDYQLKNLIWVLGYADDVKQGWYPGDDCCDILGSDTYRGETTHAAAYRALRKLNPSMPLAFHECGSLPAPEQLFDDGAAWSWVMTWHTRWLTDNNPPERLKQWYHHPKALTLQKLPPY